MKALNSLLLLMTVLVSSCGKSSRKPTETIGFYDSRALAVAYAGSPTHENKLQELMKKHQAAKASGDEKTVAELEAQGQAMQKRAHQQAFGTAPVDDILATIPERIPEIKKRAGVNTLISKWDQAALRKHKGAKQIDLTLPLVDALSPTPEQKKRAIEIQSTKPVDLR